MPDRAGSPLGGGAGVILLAVLTTTVLGVRRLVAGKARHRSPERPSPAAATDGIPARVGERIS
jgi:hypothetical protein